MSQDIYYVDAFTDKVFGGNPAAVVPLVQWLPEALMQKIAAENNLSETVFFVPQDDGYAIRWFTPTTEINLCGHATLASAYVLWEILEHGGLEILFYSKSGILKVDKDGDKMRLDFPEITMEEVSDYTAIRALLPNGIEQVFATPHKYVVVMESVDAILQISTGVFKIDNIDKDVIVTAKGEGNVDFVSRFFAPHVGIAEDPVTGSAHCVLVPYWANILQKNLLYAEQLSARKGKLWCASMGDRVLMSGYARLYMQGVLSEEVLIA